LVHSSNRAAVHLLQRVGLGATIDLAHRVGLDDLPSVPSLALGTGEVSLLNLTSAYTAFANGGVLQSPVFVRRIEDSEGRVLYRGEEVGRRVLSESTAFLMASMLSDVVNHGTGYSARQNGFMLPAGGKTGTTNDGFDVWFIGFTPDLVTGVWIGFDQPRPITAVATGGRVAAPVWARLMTRYYAGRGLPSRWSIPSRVFQAAVDPGTGLILADGCQPQSGPAYPEYFLRGMSPPSVCPSRGLPIEALADLELPLPDDEEATDLALDLPPELSESPPRIEEDEAESAEEPESTERPGGPEAQPIPYDEDEKEEPAPEPGDTPTPRASATPSPAATPTPTPLPLP
jgi:penicillin-binding protein 1A